MAKVFIQEDTLQGIADAIRGKNGSSDTYTPLQMATAIQDLSGGGSAPVGYRLPYDETNTTGLTNTLVINWTSGTGYEESVYVAYTDNNYESCWSSLVSGSNTFTILAGSWFYICAVGDFQGNESNWITSVSTTSADPSQIKHAFTCNPGYLSYPFYNNSMIYQTLFLQESPYDTFYYNKTITINVHTDTSYCFLKGTKITLADGTYKNCEDITFDDELLVWDFYNGCFASAKPMFIKKPETTNKYVKLTFDDGTCVCYTGHRGYHRIFNEQAGMFTSTKLPETPIGTITFKDDSSRPKLISKEIVNENREYYNIITDRHYNCFTNGILSSCKISNTHPIIDMKYTDIVSLDETFVKEYLEKIKNNPIWIKK